MADRRRGRPVLGAFSGLFFGFFLGLDLWLFGIVDLGNILLLVLPVLGLIGGIVLGLRPPFRRRARGGEAAPEPAPAAPTPAATPTPAAAPPAAAAAEGEPPPPPNEPPPPPSE